MAATVRRARPRWAVTAAPLPRFGEPLAQRASNAHVDIVLVGALAYFRVQVPRRSVLPEEGASRIPQVRSERVAAL